MSTPQDASNRKKQKVRAARKLALWRKKQEANQEGDKSSKNDDKSSR